MHRLIQRIVLLSIAIAAGSVTPAQTPATATLMRAKLVHSQKVLEAVMTSDFAALDRESRALAAITTAPGWDVLKTPEYKRHSTDFLRASEDLVAAAQSRDLDAAAMQYVSLTLRCYECHRYVKDERIVR